MTGPAAALTTGSTEPAPFTKADMPLIHLLIDVQSGKVGILTALRRVKEMRP